MNKLKPRHIQALQRAVMRATAQDFDLEARYIREAMQIIGAASPSKKKNAAKKSAIKPLRIPTFMRLMKPSHQLAVIVGYEPQTRVDINGKVWTYIKKNKLQDAENNRMIHCDELLKTVVNKDTVSLFEIAGLLAGHLSESH